MNSFFVSSSSGVWSAGWGILWLYPEPHVDCFHMMLLYLEAILVSQNNEMVAMLISQINPVGVELYSCGNTLKFSVCLF